MPYITKERRQELDWHNGVIESPGELNYMLTLAIKDYLDNHGKSYDTINGIIGVLEGAKQEFYRRVAAPYEDEKITQNGDVYE